MNDQNHEAMTTVLRLTYRIERLEQVSKALNYVDGGRRTHDPRDGDAILKMKIKELQAQLSPRESGDAILKMKIKELQAQLSDAILDCE